MLLLHLEAVIIILCWTKVEQRYEQRHALHVSMHQISRRISPCKYGAVHSSELGRSEVHQKQKMNVNDRLRTVIDLNESEIVLNECEDLLKANLDQSERLYLNN